MKGHHKILLFVEVFICFAPAVALLAVGGLMGIVQLEVALHEPSARPGTGTLLLMVAAGFVGLATLAYVLFQLLRGNGSIRHPAKVLAGVLIAAAPLVPYALSGDLLFAFIGLLPLLSTSHILYLARRLLVPSWQPIYSGVAFSALALVGAGSVYAGLSSAIVTEDEARERELYSPPRKVLLSPIERESLDELVATIARTSRESYDSGDWSKFAALYPPGTFECWNASGEDHRFGFLSRRGMPDSARYTIIDRRDYHDGGGVWDSVGEQVWHLRRASYAGAGRGMQHGEGPVIAR